jgi:hypothetical protein
MERLAHARNHEGVGRGAAEDKENRAIPFENITDHFARAMCPWVFAVPGCVPAIGLFQRMPDFRANPGIVITRKMAALRAGCFHSCNLRRCAPFFQPMEEACQNPIRWSHQLKEREPDDPRLRSRRWRQERNNSDAGTEESLL